MAKDSNNTKLWIGSGLRIDEIDDVLGEGVGDLGTLCKSSNINAWARYKPFRNSSKGFSSASEWATAAQAAGYGFGSSLNNLNFSATQDSPSWQVGCLLPRGVGGTYNEPYRQLDFADLTPSSTYGYDHNAVPPMSIDFPSEIAQGGSYLTINFDSNVSGWNANTGISISEVLDNAPAHSSWGQYNLALRFRNSSNYVNLLVTEYKPTQFATSLHPSVYFTGSTVSGNLYTMVPMFSENNTGPDRVYDGDDVEVTVCLVANREAQTYPYVIGYSDVAYSLGSLNFKDGMDSETLVFRERTNILGMTGTFAVEVTRQSSLDSQGLKAYRVSKIKLENLNPGPNWGDTTTGLTAVNIVAQLNVDGAAWMWSSDGSVPVGEPYFGYITVTAANTGNDYAQIALDADDVNVSRDVYSAGSTAMSNPYIFVSTGTSQVTFKVKGYAFKPPVDTGRGQVQLTEGSTTI